MTLRLSLARAHREFAAKNYPIAEFWTGRAFSVDFENLDAFRLSGDLAEAEGLHSALTWRARAAQISHCERGDVIAWAKCAIRADLPDLALKILKTLPPKAKETDSEYNELMAGCALASQQFEIAGACFQKAAEIEPANPVHRVNLATFLVAHGANGGIRAAAVRDLESLSAGPRGNLSATRALLADALCFRDAARALRFAEKLKSAPDHTFTDDFSWLDAIRLGADFAPALSAIENKAQSDPVATAELADWLNARGMASESLRLLNGLPKSRKANTRIQIALAEAHLTLGKWEELLAFLKVCNWKDCDFLRRAMLARCMRERGKPWEKDWQALTQEITPKYNDALLLAQLALNWRWRTEAIAILWTVSKNQTTAPQALRLLWSLYRESNDTPSLLRVAQARLNFDRSEPANKNNAAFLWLLLYGHSFQYEKLAHDAMAANPKVPEWAATYAFALYLAGRDAEAARIFDQMAPGAVDRPGIALYAALAFAASGDTVRARERLSRVNPAGLLPEERELAERLGRTLAGG